MLSAFQISPLTAMHVNPSDQDIISSACTFAMWQQSSGNSSGAELTLDKLQLYFVQRQQEAASVGTSLHGADVANQRAAVQQPTTTTSAPKQLRRVEPREEQRDGVLASLATMFGIHTTELSSSSAGPTTTTSRRARASRKRNRQVTTLQAAVHQHVSDESSQSSDDVSTSEPPVKTLRTDDGVQAVASGTNPPHLTIAAATLHAFVDVPSPASPAVCTPSYNPPNKNFGLQHRHGDDAVSSPAPSPSVDVIANVDDASVDVTSQEDRSLRSISAIPLHMDDTVTLGLDAMANDDDMRHHHHTVPSPPPPPPPRSVSLEVRDDQDDDVVVVDEGAIRRPKRSRSPTTDIGVTDAPVVSDTTRPHSPKGTIVAFEAASTAHVALDHSSPPLLPTLPSSVAAVVVAPVGTLGEEAARRITSDDDDVSDAPPSQLQSHASNSSRRVYGSSLPAAVMPLKRTPPPTPPVVPLPRRDPVLNTQRRALRSHKAGILSTTTFDLPQPVPSPMNNTATMRSHSNISQPAAAGGGVLGNRRATPGSRPPSPPPAPHGTTSLPASSTARIVVPDQQPIATAHAPTTATRKKLYNPPK